MIQWAVELSQFNIKYRPRTTIKAQVLIDFISEFTIPEETNKSELWTVQTDGFSTKGKGGVRVIITSLEGDILKYGVQLQFLATNNKAEYDVILTGLKLAKSMEAKSLLLKSDSKLVIEQIKGNYEAKE